MDSNVFPAGEDVQQFTTDSGTRPRFSAITSTLPTVTFPTDEASLQRAAEIISSANAADPLNTLLSLEEQNASISNGTLPATPTIETNLYIARSLRRLRSKLAAGCILAESASFAAVAIYEPPTAVARLAAHPLPTSTDAAQLPLLTEFLQSIQARKSTTLTPGKPYYKLTMMARSPDRNDRGAVRVLIEGLIERAEMEGVPIWCEAGNERARLVYAYFGFVVVGVLKTGEGVVDGEGRSILQGGAETEGVKTWGMVYWPKRVGVRYNGLEQVGT